MTTELQQHLDQLRYDLAVEIDLHHGRTEMARNIRLAIIETECEVPKSVEMSGWWYKEDLLTWVDTGQQWATPHWDDNDYTKFLAMDSDSQSELLEQLEEVES